MTTIGNYSRNSSVLVEGFSTLFALGLHFKVEILFFFILFKLIFIKEINKIDFFF